jgi:hypothetical protein
MPTRCMVAAYCINANKQFTSWYLAPDGEVCGSICISSCSLRLLHASNQRIAHVRLSHTHACQLL